MSEELPWTQDDSWIALWLEQGAPIIFDGVFTIKELEKIPDFQLVTPPQEVMQLPRKGAQPWENVETDLRDLCERALERLKQKISKRRILLRPQFQDYDPPWNILAVLSLFMRRIISRHCSSLNLQSFKKTKQKQQQKQHDKPPDASVNIQQQQHD
ncbi:unnamed protein product [Timema podura]|uniref:Uncharacterized protein n=1 Tax=Timema podura TaxID=61482 RepID=A0ABN7NEI8_TIMPD|nr:unnamed protein product [Timema podura]